MSETSMSRVTITLGRTGQVVKKDGSNLQSSLTDVRSVAGSKRSIHERLGSYVDSSEQVNYKRLRGDDRSGVATDGIHLSKDDLRYKIMHKNRLKQTHSQQNGLDLRNILSRPAQSSTSTIDSWDRVPEQKDTRRRQVELTDSRHQFVEMRDGRHLPPNRYSDQQLAYSQFEHTYDPRKQQILEAREGGRGFLEVKEVLYKWPEPIRPTMVSGVPGLRPSNIASGMESKTSSYSPWTLDQLRKRSPDERFTASSSFMAPKQDDASQNRYAPGTYSNRNTSKSEEAFELSRPRSTQFVEVAPPVGQMRSKAPPPVPSLPPYGNITQKSSRSVDDQVTVDSFLRSLDLERFAILFKVEEVDMYSLKRMTESDLAEMGIPMGPRKKIILALQSLHTTSKMIHIVQTDDSYSPDR